MLELDFQALILAQDGSAPLPFETPANPGVPPGTGGSPTGSSSGPFSSNFLLLMVGAMVLMIVISTIGPRREKKKREAMISAIKKHDKVQTVGGVIGSIVELKPDHVVLKVDESANTRITFARSAIQQILSADGGERTSPTD